MLLTKIVILMLSSFQGPLTLNRTKCNLTLADVQNNICAFHFISDLLLNDHSNITVS